MRTNEKKFQPFIWKMFMRFRDGTRFLSDFLEKLLRFLPYLLSTRGVNQAIARDMQQPCFLFFRNAFCRPSLPRRHARVAKRVFRAGDVARSRREISDQPSIRISRHGFDCSL